MSKRLSESVASLRAERPRSATLAGIGILLWLIPVALTTVLVGEVGDLDFRPALALSFWIWLGWALCLPLSVWISFRFRIGPGNWVRGVGLHFLVWLFVVASNQVLVRLRSDRPMLPIRQGWRAQVDESADGPRDSVRAFIGRRVDWYQRYRAAPPQARVILDTLLYAIIVAGCQSAAWAQIARERERQKLAAEAQLVRAQLLGLQSQLNPHFLFNALNGLNALIHDAPDDAEVLVDHLSDLLRAALSVSEEQMITLGRELDCLEHYLAVEKTRYADRLRVVREIEDGVRDCLVPTFLLQPLVENAVKHGVEPRKEGATIWIGARRRGEQLEISVRDNGPGIKQGKADESGVGLKNSRRRLEQCFPSRHRLTMQNRSGGGCEVTVSIPWGERSSDDCSEERI